MSLRLPYKQYLPGHNLIISCELPTANADSTEFKGREQTVSSGIMFVRSFAKFCNLVQRLKGGQKDKIPYFRKPILFFLLKKSKLKTFPRGD